MSKSRIVGAPPPDEPRRTTYAVLRAQKHGVLDVTLLSNTILGIAAHWVISDESGYGATQVCTQYEPQGCANHDSPDEWTGWVPVWDHGQGKRAVLRLAPREAGVMLKALGTDVDWQYRRAKITPQNKGEGKIIAVELAPTHQPAVRIPPHHIEATICLVLGCARIPRQAPADESSGEGGAA